MCGCFRKLSENGAAFVQPNDEFFISNAKGFEGSRAKPSSLVQSCSRKLRPAIVYCHHSDPPLKNSLSGYWVNCDYSLLEVVMKAGVPAAGFDNSNRRTAVYHAQISKKLQQPEAANGIGNVSFVPSALGTVTWTSQRVATLDASYDGFETRSQNSSDLASQAILLACTSLESQTSRAFPSRMVQRHLLVPETRPGPEFRQSRRPKLLACGVEQPGARDPQTAPGC